MKPPHLFVITIFTLIVFSMMQIHAYADHYTNPASHNVDTVTLQLTFGSSGSDNGQLKWPNGVALDNSGNIYVADTGNNRIEKFSPDGTYLSKFGSQGSDNVQFNTPFSIALDSSGNIYVLDTLNDEVKKFSPDGTYLSKFGSLGSDNGQFNYPEDVVLDNSGNIYVADSGNNRIEKFSPDGTYLSKFGSNGSDDGQFSYLFGIALDNSGNIYVADSGNHRVEKFSPDGTYLSKFGLSTGQSFNPAGIALDRLGDIFVTDTGNNHRVVKFYSNGTCISQFGSSGSERGQLGLPYGIALDNSGNIYVADSGNGVVEKFSSTSEPSSGWNVPSSDCTIVNASRDATTVTPNPPPFVSSKSTTTSLTSNSNSVIFGHKVNFTALVLPFNSEPISNSTTVTGKIQFNDTNTNPPVTLGTITISSGNASFSMYSMECPNCVGEMSSGKASITTTLPMGINIVVATYSGDGRYTPSTSNSVTVFTTTVDQTKTLGNTTGTNSVEKGISLIDEKCDPRLVLIVKVSDGSPVCVKSATAQKLVARGWGTMMYLKQIPKQSLNPYKSDIWTFNATENEISRDDYNIVANLPEFTKEKQYLNMETRVHGFSGMYVDNNGNLTIYTADPTIKSIEKSSIVDIVEPERVTNDIVVMHSKHSWHKWLEVQSIISNLLWDDRDLGVTMAGFDDKNQVFMIGVDTLDNSTTHVINKFLKTHKIPSDMIQLSEASIR